MTRPDVEYRARTLVHVLELMEGHVCGCDPEFQKIRDAIRGCLPELEELTGEMLPEQAEPMTRPAVAFYFMAYVEAMAGLAGGEYYEAIPDGIRQRIDWLYHYFREQLGNGFAVSPLDWGQQ